MVRIVAPLVLAAAATFGAADAYPDRLSCTPASWTADAAFAKMGVATFTSPPSEDACKIVATAVAGETCEFDVVISSTNDFGYKLGADKGSFGSSECANTEGTTSKSHTAKFKGEAGQTSATISGLCGNNGVAVHVAATKTLTLSDCSASASVVASVGAVLLALGSALRMV